MISYKGADENFSLENKKAVVTGGAAGIGNTVANFLARKGVTVSIIDQNPETPEIAKKINGSALGLCANLCNEDEAITAMETAVQHMGGLDILVNCAGIVILEPAETLSLDGWKATLDVNLTGSFLMAKSAAKYMIAQQSGAIVNIASQAGLIALDKHVAYAASKGGIIAMTKVLAYEWAKYGIRVNAVSPTIVMTELGHKAWDGPHGDAMKQLIPAGRFAEPDEIAACIAFLCSNAAGMVTGENLVIDGGYTIQ
ncbi:MAG: D-threitol dehydrogenase [Christensenella sp.]|nr:D-threitol dehydrogenase [Christensenella sp.]